MPSGLVPRSRDRGRWGRLGLSWRRIELSELKEEEGKEVASQ